MNVTDILLAAQSADRQVRTEAEKVLLNAQESNFSTYLTTLADQLAGEDNNPDSRRLAGLIMKNAMSSKSDQEQIHLARRWTTGVDPTSKTHVRQALLQTLQSSAPEARRAAAQVISKIAAIDLPSNEWDNLIEQLLQSTLSETSMDFLREASLETLGYICEEEGFRSLSDQALVQHSNRILSAVVHGMNYGGSPTNGTPESASAVRLTATKALNNVLGFSKSQFDTDDARTVIMNTIYKAAKSEDERIRCAAFEGLVCIGENYYDKLPEYIRSLYELTDEAIRKDVEPVALQAIEFWSSIAEEEINLLEESETAQELGVTPERTSKNFVATALPYLTQPIFESLKKQEDDPLDDGSWNCATAAGACLELLSQAAPTQILSLVMPFVRENINDLSNWRSREAAILSFGSVLEGPPVVDVQLLVREAVPILISTLKSDPHIAVRDTTAWTLARAIMIDRETTAANLPGLVDCLRSTLAGSENPVLAAHICYAIHNTADCFSDEADNPSGTLGGDHVEVLLRAVLGAADRQDAGEGHLRLHAYEALNTIFRSVPLDGISFVNRCVPRLLEKLETSIHASTQALNPDDVNEVVEVQGLLCGSLTTATQRLDMQQLSPFADRMMQAYLRLFNIGGEDRTVHEDALFAVGAIADKSGKEFNRYMNHFMPVLTSALATNALRHDEKHTIVQIAVAVVSDIARGLGPDLMQGSNQIVSLLLEALKSTVLNRAAKPPILSCLGDIAMAIKGQFETYLRPVMDCMEQAAYSSVSINVEAEDYDMIDWVVALRESIFEAYTGIINGLRDDEKQEMLAPYVEWLIFFAERVFTDIQSNPAGAESLTKSIASVLGDLVDAVPELKAVLRQRPWVSVMLNRGAQSSDERIRETANWAQHAIYQD